MSTKPLFLDSHATTPLGDAARDAMRPWFEFDFANPHATQYAQGRKAALAIETARTRIHHMLGDAEEAGQLVFTSGATEANNACLRGVAAARSGRFELIISSTEHSSVQQTALDLEQRGITLHQIPIDTEGCLDLERLTQALSKKTALVSIMHGHNEIGTLQDLQAIARACHHHGAWLHTDMTQSAWIEPSVLAGIPEDARPDFISLSSHKMYGPQGIGALWWNPETVDWSPIILGGGQQGGYRSGTVPVMLAVGFGAAALQAKEKKTENRRNLKATRDLFWRHLNDSRLDLQLLGHPQRRLPQNLSVILPSHHCEYLIDKAKGRLAISKGATCRADSSFSHVLESLGYHAEDQVCMLRFGFCLGTSLVEIESAAHYLRELLLQEISSWVV